MGWLLVILGIVSYVLALTGFMVFFLYKTVFENRVNRCLAVYNQPGYKCEFKPIPQEWNTQPLANFFIASSHRSYLPCGQEWDLNSYNAIKQTILAGARFIHLDVFSDGEFVSSKDAKLVVTAGRNPEKSRQFVYMPFLGKPLDFEQCLQTISDNAWLGHNYPLFLFLDTHLYGNEAMGDKMAGIITKVLGARLTNKKYGYQRFQMGEIPLGDLLSQVVLIVSNYPNSPKLAELTNCAVIPENQKFNNVVVPYQDLSYGGMTTSSNSYLTNFNSKYMTRVVVEDYYNTTNMISPKYDVFNLDASKPMSLGCQFVCMNYQVDDSYMRNYLIFFKEGGIKLKPASLIAPPDSTNKTPTTKTPEVTNKPKTWSQPGWVTFNY